MTGIDQGKKQGRASKRGSLGQGWFSNEENWKLTVALVWKRGGLGGSSKIGKICRPCKTHKETLNRATSLN